MIKTSEYRERKARQQRRYAHSEKGMKTRQEYLGNLSEEKRLKNLEAVKRYQQTTKGRANSRKQYLQHVKDGRHKRYMFSTYLRSLYNLTVEEYAWLFYDQKGLCAICRDPLNLENQKTIHVDHDHQTKEVRGLLCQCCNSFLIGAIENPNFSKALSYLGLKLLKSS